MKSFFVTGLGEHDKKMNKKLLHIQNHLSLLSYYLFFLLSISSYFNIIFFLFVSVATLS